MTSPLFKCPKLEAVLSIRACERNQMEAILARNKPRAQRTQCQRTCAGCTAWDRKIAHATQGQAPSVAPEQGLPQFNYQKWRTPT